MTQYAENFNLKIPYDHICWYTLKILSRFLKLYFRTDRSSKHFAKFRGKHPLLELPQARNYFSVQLTFRTAISHNIYLQEQWPEVFYKKTVIKIFAIFTGNHLCWSLFLIQLPAFSLATKVDKPKGSSLVKRKRWNNFIVKFQNPPHKLLSLELTIRKLMWKITWNWGTFKSNFFSRKTLKQKPSKF